MNLRDDVLSHGVKNILGYVRRSRQDIEREKRTGEDTLSQQTDLMNNTLSTIEIPYLLESEIGSGENIEDRPVFQKVLKWLEELRYQAIAVKELSRLSRGNYGDADRIIKLITNKRIIIITPYRVYDPRNTMDMRQIRFELFLAREEYEMIKERMVGARYTYAAQGKWVAGKAPYGYKYNKRTQKLDISKDEANVVKMIYDLFLNGINGQDVSFQAIATYLTNMGKPTPRGKKTWSPVQVRKILTNVLYIGTIRFRTTEKVEKGKKIERPESEHIIVPHAHDAIIDEETFIDAQQKIKSKPIQPHNPLNFDPCELAAVCVCSKCGGNLIRNCGKRKYIKKNGEESIYVKEFLKCQKNYCMSVKYRDVEEAILDYLSMLGDLDNNELNEYLSDMVSNKNKEKDTESKEFMLEQINHKSKELNQRMEFIFEKFEQGIYGDDVFLQRKKAIDDELVKLNVSKDEIKKMKNKDDDFPVEEVKSNISNRLETYHHLKNKKNKNELLRSIFEKVEVKILKKGVGRRSATFEITPILKDEAINP